MSANRTLVGWYSTKFRANPGGKNTDGLTLTIMSQATKVVRP